LAALASGSEGGLPPAGGLAGGLLVGAALVALGEYRTATFSSPVEASRLLGLPVLGVVPVLRSARQDRTFRARRVALDALGCLSLVAAVVLALRWYP
jgi:hypothetical protein